MVVDARLAPRPECADRAAPRPHRRRRPAVCHPTERGGRLADRAGGGPEEPRASPPAVVFARGGGSPRVPRPRRSDRASRRLVGLQAPPTRQRLSQHQFPWRSAPVGGVRTGWGLELGLRAGGRAGRVGAGCLEPGRDETKNRAAAAGVGPFAGGAGESTCGRTGDPGTSQRAGRLAVPSARSDRPADADRCGHRGTSHDGTEWSRDDVAAASGRVVPSRRSARDAIHIARDRSWPGLERGGGAAGLGTAGRLDTSGD